MSCSSEDNILCEFGSLTLTIEYRKNKATFHAVPPAAPLVPASGVGPPTCPGTRLARVYRKNKRHFAPP